MSFYSFINAFRLAAPSGGDLYLINFPSVPVNVDPSTISFLRQYILSIESVSIDISNSDTELYYKPRISVGTRLVAISSSSMSLKSNYKLSLSSVSLTIKDKYVYWGQEYYIFNIDPANLSIVSDRLWSRFSEYFVYMDASIAKRFTKTYRMNTRIKKKGREDEEEYPTEPPAEFSSNYIVPPEVNQDDRFS